MSAPEQRPVPPAPSYPEWVGYDAEARQRYDLSLALAVQLMEEPPHTAAARMAAEVIFRMPNPTH